MVTTSNLPQTTPHARPLRAKLTTLLHKLAIAYRAEQRSDATADELIRDELLVAIALSPPREQTTHALAERLGLHSSHIAHGLQSLLTQGLLTMKRRRPCLTEKGAHSLTQHQQPLHAVIGRLQRLSDTTMTDLLTVAIQILEDKQRARQISTQRLCVPCVYFQPFLHTNKRTPHHCGMTNRGFNDLSPIPLHSFSTDQPLAGQSATRN
jgi:predicted transcriptional regulator